MASSDLDHLKISYRTRFCCTSRVPVTDLWQGQNLLENIQDCFEEKSYDTGFSTNPGSPTLCSTPCKLRNDSYSSPSKEISPLKNDRISSVKKKAKTSALSHQTIMLQSQASDSVLPSEIPQKLSQADLVGLKNTPNLKYASNGAEEFNKIPNEVVEEFYLTVGSPGLLAKEAEILSLPQQATPTTHDKWNNIFGNSINQQPSLPTPSLETKKSLNYEDITVCSAVKKAEKDTKMSERRQKRIQSESSEKRSQDTKQKIQQRTKTNFSTLLLEAAKGNCRNSSVRRHVSSPQIYSPSPLPNDLESSNDEFIIDETDCSVSQSWILIPNKNSKSGKQGKTDTVKRSQDSERKKSRTEEHQGEKCSSSSNKYLDTEKEISDVISEMKTSKSIKHKAQAVEKSQPSKRKKLDNLSEEMGSASKSIRNRIRSEKSGQFLENKGAIMEHQSEKCEPQIDNRELVEDLVNCAEKDDFHNEESIAEVHTTLRTTKSQTASVEKSQTIEISKLRKCQKRDYKLQVSVKQHGTKQTKKKRSNISQRNQDKLHSESDRNLGQQEERAESCHSAEQILSPDVSGKQKNGTSQQVQKKGHLKKTSFKKPQMPKKRETVLKPNKSQDFTVTRSKRISKKPSTWWVVTTEQSNMSSSPALELPVNHKKASKQSKETKKISAKTLGKGTIPLKRQKSSINAKSKDASIPNKRKGRILSDSSDENCDMVHTIPNLDEEEGSLKETPNVAYSSTAEPSEECISAAENVNLTPTMLTGDSKTLVTSTMEESGPARLRNNVLTSRFNKISGDEQEYGTSTNLPDKIPSVRRTTRVKIKPLEYWRGERFDYENMLLDGFTVSGTLSNDRVSSKQKSNRKRERVNKDSCEDEQRKKKIIASLDISLGDPSKPTCVFDPGREQMVFRELVKIKGTHEFCVQDDTLKMFKILNTSMFATGTLILEPFKEKGKQYVCSDTVVFFVVSGNLLCTLHETSYNLNSGDIFYVPSGNFYNIKNLLDERSILLFTQIKTERSEK